MHDIERITRWTEVRKLAQGHPQPERLQKDAQDIMESFARVLKGLAEEDTEEITPFRRKSGFVLRTSPMDRSKGGIFAELRDVLLRLRDSVLGDATKTDKGRVALGMNRVIRYVLQDNYLSTEKKPVLLAKIIFDWLFFTRRRISEGQSVNGKDALTVLNATCRRYACILQTSKSSGSKADVKKTIGARTAPELRTALEVRYRVFTDINKNVATHGKEIMELANMFAPLIPTLSNRRRATIALYIACRIVALRISMPNLNMTRARYFVPRVSKEDRQKSPAVTHSSIEMRLGSDITSATLRKVSMNFFSRHDPFTPEGMTKIKVESEAGWKEIEELEKIKHGQGD